MLGTYRNEIGYGRLRISVENNGESMGVIIGYKNDYGDYEAFTLVADADGYVFGVDRGLHSVNRGLHSVKESEYGSTRLDCPLTRGYCWYNGRASDPDEVIKKLFG